MQSLRRRVTRALLAACLAAAMPLACSAFSSSDAPSPGVDAGDGTDAFAPETGPAPVADGASPVDDAESGPSCVAQPVFDDFERSVVTGLDWSVGTNNARATLRISTDQAVSPRRSLRIDVSPSDAAAALPVALTRPLGGDCVELSFSIFITEPLSAAVQVLRVEGTAADGGPPPLLIGSIINSDLYIVEDTDGSSYMKLAEVSLATAGWTQVSLRYSGSGTLSVRGAGVDANAAAPKLLSPFLKRVSVGATGYADSANARFFIDDLTVR
jgi:hypothetical protein